MFNQAKLGHYCAQFQRSILKEPGSGESCRLLSAAVDVTTRPPPQVTGVSLSVWGASVQQMWIPLWWEQLHPRLSPREQATVAPVDLRIEVPTLVWSLTCIANLHGLVSGFPRESALKTKKQREFFLNTGVDINDVLMTISTCSL